jgi:hypothetical protein
MTRLTMAPGPESRVLGRIRAPPQTPGDGPRNIGHVNMAD